MEDLYNKLVDLYTDEINETILSSISPAFNCLNYNNIIDFVSSHFYSHIIEMFLIAIKKTFFKISSFFF